MNKVDKNQFLSGAEVANKEGYVVKFIKGRPLININLIPMLKNIKEKLFQLQH